jgi:hypothetical protein
MYLASYQVDTKCFTYLPTYIETTYILYLLIRMPKVITCIIWSRRKRVCKMGSQCSTLIKLELWFVHNNVVMSFQMDGRALPFYQILLWRLIGFHSIQGISNWSQGSIDEGALVFKLDKTSSVMREAMAQKRNETSELLVIHHAGLKPYTSTAAEYAGVMLSCNAFNPSSFGGHGKC